jgi:peptide methionine sulfoxide reductase MsrA
VIFYLNVKQKKTAEKLITILKSKNLDVATKIKKAEKFYPAESYHQAHYQKTGGTPYCHTYRKLF